MAREGLVGGKNLEQNFQQAGVGAKTRSANIMHTIRNLGDNPGLINISMAMPQSEGIFLCIKTKI